MIFVKRKILYSIVIFFVKTMYFVHIKNALFWQICNNLITHLLNEKSNFQLPFCFWSLIVLVMQSRILSIVCFVLEQYMLFSFFFQALSISLSFSDRGHSCFLEGGVSKRRESSSWTISIKETISRGRNDNKKIENKFIDNWRFNETKKNWFEFIDWPS